MVRGINFGTEVPMLSLGRLVGVSRRGTYPILARRYLCCRGVAPWADSLGVSRRGTYPDAKATGRERWPLVLRVGDFLRHNLRRHSASSRCSSAVS